MHKIKTRLNKVLIMAAFIMAAVAGNVDSVFAVSDGTYQVVRITSYANPETGMTVDGGTNTALGDSMCASIVDTTVKLEVSNGKYYVTFGLGLMSSVKDVRFTVYENGEYRNLSYELTGTTVKNNDNCNWYRLEIPGTDTIISPILYVEPMGRDVQFFITIDVTTMTTWTDSKSEDQTTEEETTSTIKNNDNNYNSTNDSTGNASTNNMNDGKGQKETSAVSEENKDNVTEPEIQHPSQESYLESEEIQASNDEEITLEEVKNNEKIIDYLDGVSGLSYHLVNETVHEDEDSKSSSNGNYIGCIFIVLLLCVCGIGSAFIFKKKHYVNGGNDEDI